MPPRIYDKIPPLPELVFQWDGSAPIDRISARWVYRAVPPETALDEQRPTPEAILEIYQGHNAGPAADGTEGDNPAEDALFAPEVNGHSNGHGNGHYCEWETALEKAAAALVDEGWTLIDEHQNKDFQHLYFQPPADQAWRPGRELFKLNDPYAAAESC